MLHYGEEMPESNKDFFLRVLRDHLKRHGLRKIYFSLPAGSLNREYPVHPMPRLIFALSGEWTQQLHDCRKDIFPGDAVFALPGSFNPHVIKRKTGTIVSIVLFPEYVRFVYAEKDSSGIVMRQLTYHTVSGGICQSGFHLHQSLSALARNTILDQAAICKISEYLILIAIDQMEKDSSADEGKAMSTYRNIYDHLYHHFQEPLTRDDVAAEFKITPTHVSRLFNMFGNENFNSKLRRIRLDYAKELLESTKLNLEEIAGQCGFSSACYFIQVFKAAYGMSPSCFRSK